MQSDLCEHVVVVDRNIEMTLKIPKRLDAAEFKALTMKANKLFNIGGLDDTPKRAYKKQEWTEVTDDFKPSNKSKAGSGRIYNRYTPEIIAEMKSLRSQGMSFREIGEIIGKHFNMTIPKNIVWKKLNQ